jgi:hypothetical protein
MKITSQSSNQMVLREGSASGIVVGSMVVLAGLLAGYFLHKSTPMAIWIGLGAVLLGVGVICFASSITVTANKSTGQLLYEKKRLIGARNSAYAIADVMRIETRKQWRTENTPPSGNQQSSVPQQVLVAQSVIVFKTGQELALDHQKNSSNMQVGGAVLMSGQGAETAIANQMANFLGVPFQEIMPPTMGVGINIGGTNITLR